MLLLRTTEIKLLKGLLSIKEFLLFPFSKGEKTTLSKLKRQAKGQFNRQMSFHTQLIVVSRFQDDDALKNVSTACSIYVCPSLGTF